MTVPTPGRIDPIVMSWPQAPPFPGVMIGHFDGLTVAGESGVECGHWILMRAESAANRIAGFSSRGPNGGESDIIKPDISAPGVAIPCRDS